MKFTEKQLDTILDKLITSTKSPTGIYSAAESYKKIESHLHKKQIHFFFKPFLKSAAAILLICVCTWSMYQYLKPVDLLTISTLAETRNIELPDGTKVILNHYSSLTYPEKFNRKSREVNLSGEAYFEVFKDKKHSFIVDANAIKVKVLGTHFNVEAYKNNKEIRTALFEGSVSLTNNSNTVFTILKPHEIAIYNKTSKTIIHRTAHNLSNEIDWQRGVFIFNDQPLHEIARKLSNSFNVTIQIADQSLQNYRLTAKFSTTESLTEILQTLKIAGNFNYSQRDKLIRITSK